MVSSPWISVGHQLQECARKHPQLPPTIIRVKEVPSSLHVGLIWTYFIPPCLRSLQISQRIKWKYLVSTWVPPRGTPSTEALLGAVWKQSPAWQLFWEQASMNKGSREPWHSSPAGLCKPGTKPPVSAQSECCCSA